MTPPLTGFETTGTWTTGEHETDFLAQIHAETDAQVIEHGTSAGGRPLRRVELGTGPTILIVCLQHGEEPASREAALAQIRDYAYSTDPSILSYLATHRVVWIPTANPDGQAAGRRTNDAGGDSNRDYWAVTQSETRSIIDTIHAVQPNFIIDAHEYGVAAGADWWGAPSTHPVTHPAIQVVENSAFQRGLDTVRGAGFTAGRYPDNSRSRFTLAVYGSTAMHTPQLLSETNWLIGDASVRVPVQRQILDMAIAWHEENSDACTAAQHASQQHALTHTGMDQLLIRERYMHYDTPELVRLEGYQLHEPVPDRLVDTHRLVITEDNFAPMNQLGRAILPQIFDPESTGVEVSASRVLRTDPEPLPPREPLPRRKFLGYRVHLNGRTRDVIGVKAKINGRVRDILMP